MALPFAKARSTPTGTATTHYRNLERASVICAVYDAETSKWYARATEAGGGDYYLLSNSGYATDTLCVTAIEAALGTPV